MVLHIKRSVALKEQRRGETHEEVAGATRGWMVDGTDSWQ